MKLDSNVIAGKCAFYTVLILNRVSIADIPSSARLIAKQTKVKL